MPRNFVVCPWKFLSSARPGPHEPSGLEGGGSEESPGSLGFQPAIAMAMATPGTLDLQSLVASLDAALLPCLPARELQAADKSTHPSHQGTIKLLPTSFPFLEIGLSICLRRIYVFICMCP